jgi:hypothetical protein
MNPEQSSDEQYEQLPSPTSILGAEGRIPSSPKVDYSSRNSLHIGKDAKTNIANQVRSPHKTRKPTFLNSIFYPDGTTTGPADTAPLISITNEKSPMTPSMTPASPTGSAKLLATAGSTQNRPRKHLPKYLANSTSRIDVKSTYQSGKLPSSSPNLKVVVQNSNLDMFAKSLHSPDSPGENQLPNPAR